MLASAGAATGDDLELGFELDFARVVRPGSPVMIDDGRVRLRVVEALGKRVRCRVETGGLIQSQKGVNLPGSYLPIPSITDRDRELLEHAVRWDVDYVALSFVRRAEDVEDLKRLVQAHGGRQRVIAKIEKLEAIEQLEAIVAVTDALMVARGDLGVEIGAAEVPMLQKRLIRLGREAGKTVITATQMLESMIDAPEPTRAEASDVANAILDGTSAVMLSGETAVGSYPVEAVDTMVRIAAAVEPEFAYRDTPFEATRQGPRYISDVVGHAACDMAEVIEAAAIIVPTVSGETAREVSRHRPHRPDRRLHAEPRRPAPADAGLGRRAARARSHEGRRDALGALDRRRAARRHRRARRPRRDHERHERQPPGRDQHDPRADALTPRLGREREGLLAGEDVALGARLRDHRGGLRRALEIGPQLRVLAIELRDLAAQLLRRAARVQVRAHRPDAEHHEQDEQRGRAEPAGAVQAVAAGGSGASRGHGHRFAVCAGAPPGCHTSARGIGDPA